MNFLDNITDDFEQLKIVRSGQMGYRLKNQYFAILLAALLFPSFSQAAMTDKQLYAASMENDAQFIECVGNIFFAVANFQRIIVEDLTWIPTNAEFQKISKSRKSLKRALENLSTAVTNSDKLLAELSGEKEKKFEKQLEGFKSQVKDLDSRLEKIISGIDQKQLPKTEEIHHLLSLAISGTGFGMDVSKKNAPKKSGP